MEISVRDARRSFKTLLDRVEEGEVVTLLRYGRPVARLVPPEIEVKTLPSMADFRRSIRVSGRALSEEVAVAREHERY